MVARRLGVTGTLSVLPACPCISTVLLLCHAVTVIKAIGKTLLNYSQHAYYNTTRKLIEFGFDSLNDINLFQINHINFVFVRVYIDTYYLSFGEK